MAKKIERFPNRPRFNLVILLLLVIYVYIIVCFLAFYTSEHVNSYEVKAGSLMQNNRFEVVIMRDEEVVTSSGTGYVNYFINEGERGAYGNLIYTLDESGSVLEYTDRIITEGNILELDEIEALEYDLDNFIQNFDRQDFSTVTSTKTTLSNEVANLVNVHLLEDIESSASLKNNLSYNYVQSTGIVSYWIDGYENLQASDVTSVLLGQEYYAKEDSMNNDLVGTDDFVYKYCNNENWSVAFVSDDEDLNTYLVEESVVRVTFLKNGFELWGSVSTSINSMQETVIELSFTTGSIHFSSERFTDIEIELEDESGLKIPVSAIAEKEFFLIPEEYVLYDDYDASYYVNLESYLENGEKTVLKEAVEPYYYLDGLYYIEDEMVTVGTKLSMLDDTTQFVVSDKGSLIGVYNINKGYADFKQITILDQSDDYAIVQSNTTYGLAVYDYIALNADLVDDDTFINN
ncbi:MAG: HlyD family efflux transporter periplasmic adaptor subunit [Lachnospiraceae bacterium]